MVHILVTGANGYIGNAVSVLLAQRGHTVYGLIRKPEYAQQLLQNEVIPVVGDATDLKWFTPELKQSISVVIDTVLVMDSANPADTSKALVTALSQTVASSSAPKRYIYTSGVLVFGDYGTSVAVDETFPRVSMIKWRIDWENELLKPNSDAAWRKGVDCSVLRPAWVYGGSGGVFIDSWFNAGNAEGKIEIHGKPDKMWSWIHIVDLASAYALVAEAPRALVAGESFNISDHSRVTHRQVQEAFARAAGAKGEVVLLPARPDFFSQAMEMTTLVSSEKLRRTFGWKPTREHVLTNIDAQYKSYKAAKSASAAVAPKK